MYDINYLVTLTIVQCRCWLPEDKGIMWAFIGPVILIIMVGRLYEDLDMVWAHQYCVLLCMDLQ